MRIAIVALAAALMPLGAQEIKLPASLDALSAKAEESVDVTLDRSMLRLATRFLADKDDEEAKVKKLMGGIESIHVRSFQFAEEGGYNRADVDSVRAQLTSPTWSRVAGVRSKRGEDVGVYLKNVENNALGGVVVISAEPKELTIVTIIGTLDADQLVHLGGQFHIPKLANTASVSVTKELK